ncbi:MAG: MG2 domain-containing protein [Pseudomonadota bacterium]
MGIIGRLIGVIRWTPPPWLTQFGVRRFGGLLVLVLAIAAGGYAYQRHLETKPKPPGIVATATAPGITPIVDGELVPQPLVLRFEVVPDPRVPVETVESVAPLEAIDRTVDAGITLSPAHPGEWRWRDETTLVFAPSEDWPAGQSFKASWEPSLFAPGLTIRERSVEFETPPFAVTIDEFVFYQNPEDTAERRTVATLSFTHPVDPDSLDRELELLLRRSGATVDEPADALERELRFDQAGRVAYVSSETLTIPPEENFVTLEIDAGLAPTRGPSRVDEEVVGSVRIPDISSYFRVANVDAQIVRDDNNDPHQAVILEFTDRVALDDLESVLTLYLLPQSVTINGRTHNNKRWQSPREVTPDVLASAEPVEFTLNAVENDAAVFHSMSLDVPQGRYLYIRVESGLASSGDFVLAQAFDTVVRAPNYPREVAIAQSGALLPLTGDHKLTFVARGVDALRVEIGRLLDGEINHLASQTGGDIRNPYWQNYRFNEENLTTRTARYIDLETAHPKQAVYASQDLSEFLLSGGYYFITVQGWDRERKRTVGPQDRRFVLITDLGLLVKNNADNSHDVFVHSLASGRPAAGATVQLLGKNGIPVYERQVERDGRARIPSTKDLKRERAPTVFVVRNGLDSVFLPFARREQMLQLSRFDVGGDYVRNRTDADRLRAQVFSDRGLYRPGDTARLAAIVKRDDWIPVGNLPLVLNIRDPRSQTVLDERLALPDDGFFDRPFETEAASATGNYTATLYLIDERDRRRAIGSTRFKVEEFQPDRMRIRSRIEGQKPAGWLKPGNLTAVVELENLFGTPASDRRVTGEVELAPIAVSFPGYPDFVFDDPLRRSNTVLGPVTLPLPEATTNDNGVAQIPLDLTQYDKGIYRLTVHTEGFEAGDGRSVRSRAQTILSPLDALVGYKSTSNLQFLDRDAEHDVELLALSSSAEPIALDNLTVERIEERYVSTLVRQPNGTVAYQSILKEESIASRDFAIAEGGSTLALPTDRAGRFVMRIVDADGTALCQVRYTVAGARNMAGNLERNAELDLVLDAANYDNGEEIRIEVTAPYSGTGLITIERDRVYAHRWFRSDTTSSVQSITVPAGLEGNAYVNVAYVRDLDSPEIFVNPLSYAAAPFAINRDARTVDIELDAPERIQPGDTMAVSYRTDRDAKLLVYAVDEGILQVANYRMPDPLSFFLRKMALQVSTHQLVDLILPAFDAVRQAAAPGGGEARGLAGQNLNPFRRKTEPPVVFWSGIVASSDTPRSVEFEVPDYFNGELRVMAIAVSDSAVGAQQDRTTVRGPFVITPNLLTAAAPSDEFDVTVGLANNLDGSGSDAEVRLSVSPSPALEVLGDTTQTLAVAEGRETKAVFRVRARDQLGSAELRFVASSGSVSVPRTATVSIRPQVAYLTTVASGSASADPLSLSFERRMYDQLAEQSAAASASPLVLADGLLDYLEYYPHYCAEQIVSRVFPQIGFLNDGDSSLDAASIRRGFNDVIAKLRARQTDQGWFRFWLTSTEPVDFASVYIIHFLTDSAAQGLPVPRAMVDRGLGFTRQVAARDVADLPSARLRAYAIYLLTRNGDVTTNSLTNLHETLDRLFADDWHSDIAASYMAASYALLQQPALADPLIDAYEIGAGDEMSSDFDTRLGRDAQYVYLIARHFPERMQALDGTTLRALIDPVMQNRFNTVSSAYTVLALGAYTRALAAGGDLPALSLEDAQGVELAAAARFVRAKVTNDLAAVAVTGGGSREIYHVLAQTGFDREPPADAQAEGIEIFREYLDDNGDAVTSAGVGDELMVRLRIRSTGQPRSNVAVVDMLPGGFEVLTDSLRDQYQGWRVDYQDVREDRVVTYGRFTDRVTELTYRVKLTSPGRVVVPSAFASSMYDRTVHARTQPGRFEVRSN